jgi:hypothetical protein
MAYMQTPGRGNRPKTGSGLPSVLLQEIEVNAGYEQGKKMLKNQREKGNTPGGMKVDSQTGTATPSNTTHTVMKGGDYLKELDSAGKFVREVKADSKEGKTFAKNVAKNNAYTSMDQTRNANQYNASGGGTSLDKLSSGQKQTLVKLGKAKITKG